MTYERRSMIRIPTKLKPWFEARRRFKLSHAHTQMARELGMNPRKLGSLADRGQEPWKLPLPEFIVECYRKSFGRSEPEHVRSLEEVVQDEEMRRKEKQARKAEKTIIPVGSTHSAVPADGLASASHRQTRSRTLALVCDTRTMRFHANHVSSSASGDYYQAMFEAEENTNDPNSPYFLIQRQFETSDGGRCYIETHDEKYIGHFRLRRVEFTPESLSIEFDRSSHNLVNVTFSMAVSDFEEASQIIKIISGEVDPQ
jgi:hypothetical protein